MISRDELMHHRLQAWMRENKCDDLEYLGFYPDTLGVDKHWYRIAEHEVTVDCIEDLELVDAESEPFETYQHYLSLKNHFTNPKYDFFKYGAKTRASVTSFNKRKDKYWFEKTSRKYSDKEVVDFLVSNFTATDNPQNLWIGEIINSGERNYAEWMKRQQSLTYLFREQSSELFSENELESLFNCTKGHPPILKKFLSGNLSLETFVIYEKIFHFSKNFDKKLDDPVWETVSLKLKKYNPFLNIDVSNFKDILRSILNE